MKKILLQRSWRKRLKPPSESCAKPSASTSGKKADVVFLRVFLP
jgi:hypothetical protein